ncbi:MAG: DUF72 domain-containing protein [Candidatus Lokiarchaeota archaeon]|nr:DUF72 domain-containing protein [Candidatus Lokiarchaeota archaeon]MBD3341968.1 DUF72 domain-containing protein [Candidatus Lokiarchaeota archaeon]
MSEKVLIGTSGWGYDEWLGPFYPKGLKQKDYLNYYSEIFYTNEINTTFYHIPSRTIVENWVKKVPSDFLFSAKLPKDITHKHKLDIDESAAHLEVYLKVMEPLIAAGKLLAFLIQLPPSFEKEKHFSNLKEFIRNWPEDPDERGYHLVVEFRDKSWMDDEMFNYLRKNSLTYCVVIEPLLPPRMEVTNEEFSYIRFHGFGKKIWFDYYFNEGEIKEWANKIGPVIEASKRVGIYFNNHFSGYAAKNSLMMMSELGVEPRNMPEKVDILSVKKRSGTLTKGQTSLDKFTTR